MYNNRGSFWGSMPPVTKNLILINLVVWIAMLLLPHSASDKMVDLGGLHYVEASDFNIAQLLTYMFMHSTTNFAHLFFNMFTLWMFGMTLEYVLGSKRFLFYYLSCGIGAAIIQELVWGMMMTSWLDKQVEMHLANVAYSQGLSMEQIHSMVNASTMQHLRSMYESALVTIGASGAIYGVLLAYGMLFPNRTLYLMFALPVKAKWMVIGYGVIELALGLGSANDGVAHFAHLGGMIFGFFILLYWKRKNVINNGGFY